ncbi:hypothetical protein ILYODFUR_001429, partial [Ilyodon furcidens]
MRAQQLTFHSKVSGVFCFYLMVFYKPLQALNWVFVVDTMNFSFWPEKEAQQCEVTYKGTTYTGYMTLCAAITRAMEEGVPITDPKYFSQISVEELGQVLRSDNETAMPMLQERHQ